MPEVSVSVFVPKKFSPDVLKPSSEKPPLGDLAQDEQTVAGFTFYFAKILSGEIDSPQELQAKLNQRFKVAFSRNSFFVDEDGNYLRDKNTQPISRYDNTEDFKIEKIKQDLDIITLTPGNFLQYLRSIA